MAAVLAASPPRPPAMFAHGHSVSSSTTATSFSPPRQSTLPDELKASSSAHSHQQQQFRPAKNIEAFTSLLPPAVEFVEGSSTGTIALGVAEGKYQPINVSPVKPNGVRSNGAAENVRNNGPVLTPSKRPNTESTSAPKSLYNQRIDTTWVASVNVGNGLYNIGNTCFLNSALQCLLHTPPLFRVIFQHEANQCRVKNGAFCMSCSFRALLRDSFSKSRVAHTPSSITKNLHHIAKHLRRGRQEDSHEFLRYAIDAFQKSCIAGYPPKMDPKLAETTWVHKIFGGRLRSRVTCSQCGHNSDTFDSILDLSIDVHRCESLKEALRKFTEIDYLKGADKYKCEKCKRAVNAEKRFTIHDAPVVLTVHLKRFTPMGRKLTHLVNYDEKLSLQPSMSEGQYGPTYSLYGVISHAGSGPNSGHYYAHVKASDGSWYEMNDESVDRLRSAPVGKKSAYILFYIKDKGQSLQAVVNGTPSSSTNGHAVNGNIVKKRKVVTSDDEDEDTGKKTVSSAPATPARFIGPVLPSNVQANKSLSLSASSSSSASKERREDPQAAKLKKKIEDVERKKMRPKPLETKNRSEALSALNAYSDDDDEDKREVVEAPPLSASVKSPTEDSIPSTASTVQSNDADMRDESSPQRPPPTSSPTTQTTPTSSPPKPIPASRFYGKPSKRPEEQARKRKSPGTDSEDDNDEDEEENEDEDETETRGGRSSTRLSSSQRSDESFSKSTGNTSSRSFGSGSNPFSRLKGSNTLDDEKSNSVMFRPRKLTKRRYGGTRKPFF